jgi:transposase
VDAVHPTHAARPVGCWTPKQEKLAIEQTSGRERINIHGAIDLETGQTRMIDVETVNAASTITLLEAIEALYPMLALIHVFLDNARYHHAKLVQDWLARPDCRIKLHFIPSYCPHLNPIERLWGLMHRTVGGYRMRGRLTTRRPLLWPSTSVRCDAAIFPESEVDRTRHGHREDDANDPLQSSLTRSVCSVNFPPRS